ncbi:kinesin-domain-containing protein [Martensiomyces pterosporus]|nr:kinesin-domain-containing protein [Martensiomyces pterosporus]
MSKSLGKQTASQDKGTNIQVVVRCRGRNERERKENSPTVIDVPQIRGKEVTVRGSATTRQYHFDRVFGPQADQELVYREIVSPILDEVMQGYNCTIFAYGQTGTGKTYTMEGDLDLEATPQSSLTSTPQDSRVPTPANPPSGFNADLLNNTGIPPNAGIIPRTLRRLFQALDRQSAEYYVHVSYLELYNEELRDLLAGGDVNEEINNPRGTPGFEASSHLKVYESGTEKGVIVQGLEEKIVTNARDAVALMHAGSLRRRVAATRCNDASSRSHAIFTITVFIRERAVTVEGEDIVKLGKLNLVDLAGSENIGRSGAENLRAKEAGSINKSLLVLGRVINALVEKHSHVPYRDSKLTRILKDSLGGRTRTCLIATISPSRSSIEETIKTLDYANQAKSIRNKPEANKKVSKSDIVNDMQMYIERLRSDLEAARDSSGFYVTKETYEELTTEAKESKKLVDEWKQRVALWEEEMKRMNEEYTQLSRQNDATNAKLEETESQLANTQSELDRTRTDLRHQTVITMAHAKHESALDSTARLLHSSLAASSSDAAQLHNKVARMGERERLNLQAVASISQLVGAETSKALSSVAEYNRQADSQTRRLLSTLQDRVGKRFEAAVTDKIRDYEARLSSEIAAVAARAMESGSDSQQACKTSVASVSQLLGELKDTIAQLSDRCIAACSEYASEVQEYSAKQADSINSTAISVRSLLDSCVGDVASMLNESQSRTAQVIQDLAREVRRLKEQNALKTKSFEGQVESFRMQSREADSTLLEKIRSIVDESRKHESVILDDLLSTARSQADLSNTSAKEMLAKSKAVGDGVGELSQSLLSRVSETQTGVQEKVSLEQRASSELLAALAEYTKANGAQVGDRFEDAKASVANVQERAAAAEAAAVRSVDSLHETLAGSVKECSALSAASARKTSAIVSDAIATWSSARSELSGLAQGQSNERDGFASELNRGISSIAEVVDRETASGIRPTEHAGSTPRKTKYKSVAQWNRTLPHHDILSRLSAASGTGLEEQLEWTGVPVKPDLDQLQPTESPDLQPYANDGDASADFERASTPTLGSPAMTLPVNGNHAQDAPVATASPDSKAMRKRTSESAISPTSDAATQRPTRRPRTRAARHADVADEEAEMPDAANLDSAIPVPAPSASRLPVPRRSRRTRG